MSDVADDPMRTLAVTAAIVDGSVVPYYLEDRKVRIAIARVAGRLCAFDDLCVCAEERCPLSGGLLEGTRIMCQCHGSWFDIVTGAVVSGPANEPLRVYEVRELDGLIAVRA